MSELLDKTPDLVADYVKHGPNMAVALNMFRKVAADGSGACGRRFYETVFAEAPSAVTEVVPELRGLDPKLDAFMSGEDATKLVAFSNQFSFFSRGAILAEPMLPSTLAARRLAARKLESRGRAIVVFDRAPDEAALPESYDDGYGPDVEAVVKATIAYIEWMRAARYVVCPNVRPVAPEDTNDKRAP